MEVFQVMVVNEAEKPQHCLWLPNTGCVGGPGSTSFQTSPAWWFSGSILVNNMSISFDTYIYIGIYIYRYVYYMVLSWVSKAQIRPQTTYCGEAPRMHRRAAILSKAPVAVCGEENQQSCELGEFDHLWGPSAGPKRSKAELF